MSDYAVTAIGRDRPGIVAAITGALLEAGGNVEDSQMSNLGGHFAVMLLVSVERDDGAERLRAALAPATELLGLEALSVAEVGSGAPRREPATHVLSVYGADHRGIVHAVSSALAQLGVNITDLETRVAGGADSPVYVMQLEVSLGEAAEDDVGAALARAAEKAGVEIALRELSAEAL